VFSVVVDNSSSYELTAPFSYVFAYCVVESSNNTESVLFYKAK